MGSGKSVVGAALAQQLGWPRIDTDEMIARKFGLTISEIFEQLGEGHFREAESEVLQKLETDLRAVIVTGGGIILRPENVGRLRELGTIVWLKTDLAILQKRLAGQNHRPLLQTQHPATTIAKLFTEREQLYQAAADVAVDTFARDPQKTARTILDELRIST